MSRGEGEEGCYKTGGETFGQLVSHVPCLVPISRRPDETEGPRPLVPWPALSVDRGRDNLRARLSGQPAIPKEGGKIEKKKRRVTIGNMYLPIHILRAKTPA